MSSCCDSWKNSSQFARSVFFACSQPSRSCCILCFLADEPLLEAAFFRYETSRLFVTVFAYLLIVAGLFWVTIPYLLRDQINWSAHSNTRWHTVHGIAAVYGLAILACAFTQY